MNVVLLRVGIDSGCGGIQGPLFSDGSFEFLCMPDQTGSDARTYGNMFGRSGCPLVSYFPMHLRAKMAGQSIHVDPEFDTFTYGDPTIPKRGLRRLQPGDLLIFYAGLQGFDCDMPPALYLVGYFEVALAGLARELGEELVQRQFPANFHVRNLTVYEQDRDDLILIKGGSGSRLLTRAYPISEMGEDASGQPLKVLRGTLREVFGDFGGRNSIQRSPPRWVGPEFVSRAAKFVRQLP